VIVPLWLSACKRESDDSPSPAPTDVGVLGHSASDASTATGHTAEPLAWVALDNGWGASCGLLTDGRLECWGYERWTRDAPRDQVVSFDLSVFSGCAVVESGGVSCWCSAGGQRPCTDVPTATDFVRVKNATYVACGEHVDHHLTCWGAPEMTRAPAEPVEAWDLEINGGCAIVEGYVQCWGEELLELFALSADADPAPPTSGGFVDVSVGRSHGCVLDKAGEVTCWGSTGLRERFPDPPAGPFVKLESFNQISCGLREDGRAECWYDLDELLELWSWPADLRWAQFSLGEWDGCGLTIDGEGVCFPEEYESYGEQQVPDLADL
jgi:hypothetical protein